MLHYQEIDFMNYIVQYCNPQFISLAWDLWISWGALLRNWVFTSTVTDDDLWAYALGNGRVEKLGEGQNSREVQLLYSRRGSGAGGLRLGDARWLCTWCRGVDSDREDLARISKIMSLHAWRKTHGAGELNTVQWAVAMYHVGMTFEGRWRRGHLWRIREGPSSRLRSTARRRLWRSIRSRWHFQKGVSGSMCKLCQRGRWRITMWFAGHSALSTQRWFQKEFERRLLGMWSTWRVLGYTPITMVMMSPKNSSRAGANTWLDQVNV